MFYDIYSRACEAFGVAPTTVLNELGISKSAYSGWKSGGTPSNRTKKQIADYFGMTVAELMSGETKKTSATRAEGEDELLKILEKTRRTPGMRTLFSLGANATPEQLKTYIDVIKAMGGRENGGDDY